MSGFSSLSSKQTRKFPFFLIPISLLLLCLQLLFAAQISLFEGRINFMFLVTLLWGFKAGAKPGTIAGFASGLLYDIFASTHLGTMALCLSLAGYLAGMQGRDLFEDGLRTSLIFAAGLALLVELIFSFILLATGVHSSFFTALVFRVFPSFLLDFICAALLLFLVQFFLSRRKEQSSYKAMRYR